MMAGSPRISIVSPADTWMNPCIGAWLPDLERYEVNWVHDLAELDSGDIAFFLSFDQIVGDDVLAKHTNNIVVHASALPEGKGWSPLTWQILEGQNRVPLTLFEAVSAVDAGPVYLRGFVDYEGHELIDELRKKLGLQIVAMCNEFIAGWPESAARGEPQSGQGSVYPRRGPDDSRLDAAGSIESQFDLFRVADNERYPVFFDHMGYRYQLTIEKVSGEDND